MFYKNVKKTECEQFFTVHQCCLVFLYNNRTMSCHTFYEKWLKEAFWCTEMKVGTISSFIVRLQAFGTGLKNNDHYKTC